MSKLYAVQIRFMLQHLDDAQRCYRDDLPLAGDNYIATVRRTLLDAALSDVEVEPIPAPTKEPVS